MFVNDMNRMSEEEYRAHPGVNKSTLWEIRKSPKHYKWLLENPTEDTDALRLGRAVHMAILQPTEFEAHYIKGPEGVGRRTKEGKAIWAEFLETAGDREILKAEEWDQIEVMAQAVFDDVGWCFEGDCLTEVPLFWKDERTGMECKCRLDAIQASGTPTGDVLRVIDLKTTTDASTKAFTRDAVKLGYHVQAAHYLNGVRANNLDHGMPIEWYFVAVEKKPPYAVNVLKADNSFLDEGQFQLNKLMDTLDRCRAFDEWPGYGGNDISIPAWMMKNEEDENE